MKRKSILLMISVLSITTLLTTGCGKEVSVKGSAVDVANTSIKANDYYKEIKASNISRLVDQIDKTILEKKYKTDDEEKKSIKDQIEGLKSNIKQYYGNEDEDTFNNIIKQYYGVDSINELEETLSLEYKRNKAVTDYVKKNLKDSEIKKYYDENIYGDMAASHILISIDVKDKATDEEKTKAEEKALKKANEIIEKLNNGKKFKDLAEKYSDDKASASKGGDLGTFKYSDMVSEFSNACKELEVNEYTKEPIKTEYGYHIILKTKQEKKAKLEKVKEDIKETLTNNKLSADKTLYYETLKEIRKDNKIKWNDDELKKAYNDLMKSLIEKASTSETTTQE